ncbi:MAG TPA: Crp/Fnr family transcriptional regulator [Burkholderiales bacterium]|nr:Crp/Fnr family transcriptional regulator [Burkholderiales bacterium]
MGITNDSATLTAVPWLAPLGSESLAALIRASRRVALTRGQVLWRRGERTDAVAVIVRGRIDVVRHTASGRRMLLRSLGPRESVGLSTLSGLAHSADLVAGESSAVLVIPGRALRETVRRDPTVALRALAQLGGTIADLSDELEEFRFLQLDERLLRLIRRRARALRELRITHDELAQQVGATRENVSRALKRMERRGAITCRRGRIDILSL